MINMWFEWVEFIKNKGIEILAKEIRKWNWKAIVNILSI